ncbi:MAG TPA: hypothetical protein V6D23_04265, partial [Candidatus Obscuribacterales bacterium]
QALKTQSGQFAESSLHEVLGEQELKSVKAKIGVQPAQTHFSADEKLIRDAQEFFDYVSTLPLSEDDYLSSDNLVTHHRDIQNWPFFRQMDKMNLDERTHLAQLIADNKISVPRLQPHFADKYIFHKKELDIHDLPGDFHLKDFLNGSVADKARQFVAIDKFAQMVHDTTQKKLAQQEEQLRLSAKEPQKLETSLKKLDASLKPYQDILDKHHAIPNLDGATIAAKKALLDTLKLLIQAEQSKSGQPKLSDAELEAKYQNILAADKLIREYGTNGADAAKKMLDQAETLKKSAKELGVTGTYAEDRLEFRKKAFALYYNKDLDMLHGAFVEGMKGLGPDAAKVVAKAEEMEKSIDRAKTVAKVAVHLVASLTGAELVLKAGELAFKIGDTYRQGKWVDVGLRSQEAQDKAWKDVAWDVVDLAVSAGFKYSKYQWKERIKDKADEVFDSVKGMDKNLVKNMQDWETLTTAKGVRLTKAEVMHILDAREAFIQNITAQLEHHLGSLKAIFDGMSTVGREGDLSKGFSQILINGLFHQHMSKIPATDRLPYLTAVAGKLLGPGAEVTSKGLHLLQGDSQPLLSAQKQEAEKQLAEYKRLYPNLNLPASVETREEFVKVLEKVALAGQPDISKLKPI